jgi:hypothetical protein
MLGCVLRLPSVVAWYCLTLCLIRVSSATDGVILRIVLIRHLCIITLCSLPHNPVATVVLPVPCARLWVWREYFQAEGGHGGISGAEVYA